MSCGERNIAFVNNLTSPFYRDQPWAIALRGLIFLLPNQGQFVALSRSSLCDYRRYDFNKSESDLRLRTPCMMLWVTLNKSLVDVACVLLTTLWILTTQIKGFDHRAQCHRVSERSHRAPLLFFYHLQGFWGTDLAGYVFRRLLPDHRKAIPETTNS